MFDYAHFFEALLESIKHVPVSLFILLVSLLTGSFIGLIIAILRYYKIPVLSQLLAFIVTVIKGIPIVLMLLASYLFLSEWINYISEAYHLSFSFEDIDSVYIALIPFIISSSVQASEIFRGALQAIDQGQFDVADSVGLSRLQTLRRIILPQMFPVSIPQLGNLSISLLKASSLASLIAVVEILMAALITANSNYRFLESYMAAALVYWILAIIIEQATKYLEKKQNYIVKGAVS